jgi:hypothetical protein|tara:strand:- start:264 stop:407 length:144 start_codon:yes stop_codon:yes gene_type:complete
VDFTGAVGVDIVGRLGINELQAVKESRVKQAIQLVKVFMLVLVPTFI